MIAPLVIPTDTRLVLDLLCQSSISVGHFSAMSDADITSHIWLWFQLGVN